MSNKQTILTMSTLTNKEIAKVTDALEKISIQADLQIKRLCIYCMSDNPIYKNNGKGEPICEGCAFGVTSKPAPVIPLAKQGRNEKCNCGSGLKFKNCCAK